MERTEKYLMVVMDEKKDTNVLKRNECSCDHVEKDRMISDLLVNIEVLAFKTLF